MTSQTLDLCYDILKEDNMACGISDTYLTYDSLRSTWKNAVREVREYVYATDTTQTSNSKLPWKNKTTIPKLCHIRDNLYSNYTSVLFPQRKWLIWEANAFDAASIAKQKAIVNYMAWAVEQPSFKHELDKIILDYIDYGNCFATVEWVDERVVQPSGMTQMGYIGPAVKRINPMDIVMNPTAESFGRAPKIVRSIINRGELKKLLNSLSNDENREAYEELYQYFTDIRHSAANAEGDWSERDNRYALDGFGSFRDYLQSNFVEILTFY